MQASAVSPKGVGAMKLIPKNWSKFQHYRDRCPPWIKLHKDLLNDRSFIMLPTASKALAPMMWLLASESKTGEFDASPEELGFRLRMSDKEITTGVKALIDSGFFLDANTMLAPRLQDASAEGEGEGEGKKREREIIDFSSWPEEPDKHVLGDWMAHRKKKKLSVSQTVITRVGKELHKAKALGFTVDDCLGEAVERGWQGIKADWMANNKTGQQPAQQNQLKEF